MYRQLVCKNVAAEKLAISVCDEITLFVQPFVSIIKRCAFFCSTFKSGRNQNLNHEKCPLYQASSMTVQEVQGKLVLNISNMDKDMKMCR